MDADEREVCAFLKSFPGQYISPREIARRAGGKWKFLDNQHWAVPVLARLKEKNIVESSASGHFRLTGNLKKEKQKKWISPHLKKILERSGKNFEDLLEGETPAAEGAPKTEGQTGAEEGKT